MVKIAEHIEEIKPYKPGKPVSEVARELGLSDVVKLASNENPLGPPPKAVEALKIAAEEASIYPDGNAYHLKNAIIEYLEKEGYPVKFDQIMIGNGSNEIIDIAMRALVYGDEEVIISEQGFIVYELISKAADMNVVKVPLREDKVFDIDGFIEKINEKTKLICLINPNNPTGTYYTESDFERILEKTPDDAVVLVDEAYVEFAEAEDYPNSLDFHTKFPNIITVRTFSKAFGLSGIRLGYCVTTEEIADYMNRVREPFNTNYLAQKAGIAALQSLEHVEKTVALNKEAKQYFYKEFETLKLPFLPSQTNFIMVKIGDTGSSATECFDFMLKKGVIVRPMAGYGFPDWIRVSTGTEEQNKRCVAVLSEFCGRN